MAKGWVRKAPIYENIKDVYSNRSRGWPFSEFRIEGKYAFKNTGDSFQSVVRDGDFVYDDKSYLKLEDKDTPFGKPSGAVKLVVAPNWRVKLWIGTDNNNYWEDNSELDNIVQRDNVVDRQDVIIVTLDGNDDDYLSIDIDQQFSGINNFRLRSGGVMRNDSTTKDINDEVRIAILSAEHYEEVQDEVAGPMEEGGTGDLDGDGVPDGEDFDPNDPDIQEQGDVDDDPDFDEDELTEEQKGGDTPPPPPPPPTPPEDEEASFARAIVMAIVLGAIGWIAWNMVRRVPLPGGEDSGE